MKLKVKIKSKLFSFFLKEKNDSDKSLKESIETRKALYEYFQKQVEHEKSRFHKLEDKASKFLTMISVIITAYIFVTTKFLEEFIDLCLLPKILQLYQIILISLLILLFISLSLSWLNLLKVFKLQTTRHLPSSQETIDVYVQNSDRLGEIYIDNANKMKEVIDEYKSASVVKAKLIKIAYKYISISGILFVIIILLSIIYKYLV